MDTLGVIELDNTPLTPTQQQQVCPSNSVVRLLEWISRRIGENMGHMYELIFPQVKRLLDLLSAGTLKSYLSTLDLSV